MNKSRIIRYIELRGIDVLLLKRRQIRKYGMMIPVSEVKSICELIHSGSMETFLDNYDNIAQEWSKTQHYCYCGSEMIRTPEGRTKHGFFFPKYYSTWRYRCPKCGSRGDMHLNEISL